MGFVAPLAVPLLEGAGTALAGAWAWATSTTGMTIIGSAAVTAGGATVVMNNINNQADAQAGTGDPCPTCKPKDKQKCESLKRTMENQVKEINEKRFRDLMYNPKSLPWDVIGGKARDSVVGHLGIVDKMQGDLARNALEYVNKNCGPLPKGVLETIMAEPPAPTLGQ